jgi:hypothetical protein
MGMNKEAVQNERQPRNTATVRTQMMGEENDTVTANSITVTAMQQFNGMIHCDIIYTICRLYEEEV